MIILVFVVIVILIVIFLLGIPPQICDNGSKEAQLSIWQKIRSYRDVVRKRRELPKEVIMAMSQRNVYKLGVVNNQTNDNDDENGIDMRLWKLINTTTVDLDSLYPLVKSMDVIIDSFCDRIQTIVTKYKVWMIFSP